VRLEAKDFSGRVTFITGPEKHCGKTTLLNRALGLLREAGEKPAFLGVGFDGECRDDLTAARKPRIRCEAGEVFVTAERYLRASACLPEILDLLPGRSAMGRLAIAKARRGGEVIIVGPERNDLASFALERIREEGWASSVVVDGAINRITQVSAFFGARFLFALRVGPADLDRQAKRARLVASLACLPAFPRATASNDGRGAPPIRGSENANAAVFHGAVGLCGVAGPGFPARRIPDSEAEASGLNAPAYELFGPLTEDSAARLPEDARSLIVEDFTKVFLDLAALGVFRRGKFLGVRSSVDFGGFVVVLRDLSRERFEAALGDDELAQFVAYNPYEAACA